MLDSVVLNAQWTGSLADTVHHIGCSMHIHTQKLKRKHHALAACRENAFRRYWTELLIAGGQRAAALKSFTEI